MRKPNDDDAKKERSTYPVLLSDLSGGVSASGASLAVMIGFKASFFRFFPVLSAVLELDRSVASRGGGFSASADRSPFILSTDWLWPV